MCTTLTVPRHVVVATITATGSDRDDGVLPDTHLQYMNVVEENAVAMYLRGQSSPSFPYPPTSAETDDPGKLVGWPPPSCFQTQSGRRVETEFSRTPFRTWKFSSVPSQAQAPPPPSLDFPLLSLSHTGMDGGGRGWSLVSRPCAPKESWLHLRISKVRRCGERSRDKKSRSQVAGHNWGSFRPTESRFF